MAEVLGFVASGFSVAQVAGSILTNSLKLKGLLDEVKDAPENLKSLLDQLELLIPILSRGNIDSSDHGSTASPCLSPSSHLEQALQKALTACQAAAGQLEGLATDLMSQVDAAHVSTRRKRLTGAAKVVLKKGVLAQHEMRLQRTVKLLTLAQTAYLIELQRTQHETLISQITFALIQSSSASNGHIEKSLVGTSSESRIFTKPPGRSIPVKRRVHVKSPCEYFKLGFANVTGLFRVYTSYSREDHQTTSSSQGRLLQIQVQMPRWLCTSVFDAALCRSYAGWHCSLTVSIEIPRYSKEGKMILSAIYGDDVDTMHRLFQERHCRPMDHLIRESKWWRLDHSLLRTALELKCWRIAEYLLSLGAECENFLPDIHATTIEHLPHLDQLLRNDDISDAVRMKCLASCPDDLNSFSNLVDRVWPPNASYAAAFDEQRLDLAMTVADILGLGRTLPSSDIFRYICGSLSLENANADATTRLLSSLALALGRIVWRDPGFADNWYRAIRDAALRLNKDFLMPEQQLYDEESIDSRHLAGVHTTTPFTFLFLPCMLLFPGQVDDSSPARQHKIASRLANCEKAVHWWLAILQDCGVDLLGYGRQLKRSLRNEFEFRIFRDLRFLDNPTSKNGEFRVKLINLRYGSQPEDWKVWWSEPTDELVGDFWREIEPEELYVPGSWVED